MNKKSSPGFDLEIKKTDLAFPEFKHVLATITPHYSWDTEPCYISNIVLLQNEHFVPIHTLTKKVMNNGFADPIISSLRMIKLLFDLKTSSISKIKIVVNDYLLFLHLSGQVRQPGMAHDALWRKIRAIMRRTGIRLEVELGKDWKAQQIAFSKALRMSSSFLGTKERLQIQKSDFVLKDAKMKAWLKNQNRIRGFERTKR